MGQDRKVVTVRIERLPIREDRIVEHIISKRNYSTKDSDVVYVFSSLRRPGMTEEEYREYIESLAPITRSSVPTYQEMSEELVPIAPPRPTPDYIASLREYLEREARLREYTSGFLWASDSNSQYTEARIPLSQSSRPTPDLSPRR